MKKYILLAIFLASALLITPNFSFGATSAEIQSQIQAIMAQIQALQQKLAQLQNQQGDDRAWCHTFNTNLMIGNTGDEVNALQIVLQKEGFSISSDEMAKTGGTPGVAYSVPANFSESTASAVTGFQEKYRTEVLTPVGLKYGTGYVGKSTRAKLNQLYGCGVITPKPEGAGYLEIEPSSASIAIGESKSFQAFYQPPMPKCPEGFACPQVMPARIPVSASWSSSNSSVAYLVIAILDCAEGSKCPGGALYASVRGISNGTADIKAAYKSPSGTVLTATARVTVGSVSSVPSITVLSPNGGEVLTKGKNYVVQWSSKGGPGPFDIFLVKDGKILGDIGFVGGVDSSSFSWTVGADPISNLYSDGAGYKIRVSNQNGDIYDDSNAPFSIVAAGTGSTNTAPKIIGIPAIPSSIQTGQSVSFSWNATDADRDNLSWSVNWGDGTGSVGACAIPTSNLTIGTNSGTNFTTFHSWSKVGTYKVQVSVSDCKGGSDTNTFNVTVSGASGTNVQYPNTQFTQ